ncbi:hypothetical protein EXIGLDRAFT_52843 [Exidia glandulosa HHB12029]|uniref:Uncharacterized protein n=1 Tax=Exidia glandulosa HHB12029 TaxID=1314781 RepID=A0A165ID46_EXIGL|nr:hypothetical protein EXIGLDRAFT_52843 [Exidia glandulosa HHB12029]
MARQDWSYMGEGHVNWSLYLEDGWEGGAVRVSREDGTFVGVREVAFDEEVEVEAEVVFKPTSLPESVKVVPAFSDLVVEDERQADEEVELENGWRLIRRRLQLGKKAGTRSVMFGVRVRLEDAREDVGAGEVLLGALSVKEV